MATTIDDINAARDAALAILNQKIGDANDLKNGGAAGMDATINALVEQRATVAAQAYAAALDDPTMAQALAAVRAATADMKTVAARMVSATTFITNVAGFLGAADKVVTALKGSG